MYDKKPNKCLNLSITDLRRVSGKYIIGEKNGFVKEYNCYIDEFLFEGEYLKGKKKEKEKNLLKIVKQYLKENIKMEKEMDLVKNILNLKK